jgi:hypothetical protein
MVKRFFRLSCLALFLGVLLPGQSLKAQSVGIIEHKKVPLSQIAKLKIVGHDGSSITGQWFMETSEAISLMTKSGRKVIIDKTEIAEIYRCERQTNYGFFVGFMSGITGTFFVLAIAGSDEENDYLAAPSIGVLCGLVGAIIGTLHEDCKPIHLEGIDFTLNTDSTWKRYFPGIRLSYSF